MLKKAAALLVVGASLATWTSCGSTSSRYLYAALPEPSQIVEYREDPNSGVLTVLAGSPIAAGLAVQAVAVHPSNKFLYAANSGEADISLFTIGSDGALTEVTPRTPIGPTGTGATSPSLLLMDQAGAFLYAGNTGGSFPSISVFSIDSSSGALTAVGGSPFAIGGIPPLNMVLSPSGNVLYVTLSGSPGYIEVWGIGSGVLSGNPVQVVQPGTNPTGIAIDPSGSHLYVANTQDNSISIYSIGSDGSLTELSGSPIGQASTYSAPIALMVDNSAKYLYVANEATSNLSAYTIGSDGSLSILSTSPFGTSSQPRFITSDTSGKFLFVGTQSGRAIQSFSLDGGTGALTAVATYSTGGTPISIALTH